VSEHILLGGDNVDLAIAHLMEPRLAGGGGQLSGAQWDHLVASCRDLKERALAGATWHVSKKREACTYDTGSLTLADHS
jgi:hypothetical protein